ncbi:MAG: hypothetical protein ACKO96_25085, partial [Flammeovirgaceae bacterium]
FKNWISIIGLATPIVAFIIYTKYVGNEYKEIRQKGSKTIGEITVFGSDIICSFKIDGVDKTKRMSKPHESMRDGERYYVYYYSLIPNKYYINFSEPVVDTLLFNKTMATRIKLKGDYFLFEYQVSGKSYERYQETIPELQKNGSYPVFYNQNDPKIAYLIP